MDYPKRMPKGSSVNRKEMIKEENLKNLERRNKDLNFINPCFFPEATFQAKVQGSSYIAQLSH